MNSLGTNGFAYCWQTLPDCDLNKHTGRPDSDGISPTKPIGIGLQAHFKVFLESNGACPQPREAPLGVFVLTTAFKLIKFVVTQSHF